MSYDRYVEESKWNPPPTNHLKIIQSQISVNGIEANGMALKYKIIRSTMSLTTESTRRTTAAQQDHKFVSAYILYTR